MTEGNLELSDLERRLAKGNGKDIMDRIRQEVRKLDSILSVLKMYPVRIDLLRIVKDMVDMETGQRGFLITGQLSFLQPYFEGRNMLKQDMMSFQTKLTENNRLRHLPPRFERIRDRCRDWQTLAAEPEIKMRLEINQNKATMQDVSDQVDAQKGKLQMDELRSRINQFIEVENQLNRTRHNHAENLGIFAFWMIIVGFLSFLLLSVFFLYRVFLGRQSLKEAQLTRDLSLESAKIGLWSWHPFKDSWRWDLRFNKMLENKDSDCSRQIFLRALHPDDRVKFEKALSRCSRKRESLEMELRVNNEDGYSLYQSPRRFCR